MLRCYTEQLCYAQCSRNPYIYIYVPVKPRGPSSRNPGEYGENLFRQAESTQEAAAGPSSRKKAGRGDGGRGEDERQEAVLFHSEQLLRNGRMVVSREGGREDCSGRQAGTGVAGGRKR